MHRFVVLTLNGISTGMIYAAMALSLVLIWRATRIVNFAQGSVAMITTYIALTFVDRGHSYWVAFAVALASGLAIGAVVERVFVRPVESAPPLNAVILTLGLLLVLEGVAPMIWGGQIRSVPAAFSIIGVRIGSTDVALSRFDLFTIASVIAVMLALLVLFRATGLGLKMRASAFAPEVARLLGVRVGRMLTLGWALAALVGALAGLLVAPVALLSPTSMDAVLVYGFTAAVLGGLDSPVGALAGGLGIGLGLSYIAGYLGSDLVALGAFGILIVVLMMRPQGLFAAAKHREV